MSDQDDTEKQHEPSQRKLDEARRKGEVPRSSDLSGAISYAGFLLAAITLGGWIVSRLGSAGVEILEQAVAAPAQSRGKAQAAMAELVIGAGVSILPVFLVPASLVFLYLLAQRGLLFTPSKLQPKLSRVSPIANAKNKYGRTGLFEFAKSASKLVVVALILAGFLWSRSDVVVGAIWLEPEAAGVLLGRLGVEFLMILVVVLGLVGGLDLAWQISEHHRRNRMSRKELQDEAKESEGDPHMKQSRRQRGQEIALNSMLRDVAASAVVIVNPEHYAVALKWEPSFTGPPLCLAKGVDAVAARIRAAAQEAGVPIHRDPPTARALFATVGIGQEILPEHYRAVAAAIRFSDQMRRLARTRVLD